MKCPQCGYLPPRGRPRTIDDAKIRKLWREGLSLAIIAERLSISKSAVHVSLKRSKGKL